MEPVLRWCVYCDAQIWWVESMRQYGTYAENLDEWVCSVTGGEHRIQRYSRGLVILQLAQVYHSC